MLLQWDQHNAGDGAGCSSTDGIIGNPYEPGQAVGVGIKAEMWKTKHPNLTVLETGDDTPVLVGWTSYLFCLSE